MERKRIAIACQGGGSQCAFVAGALKALLARGAHQHFQIVGLSGTSGGGFTAALAWLELLRLAHDGRPATGDSIIACWEDLTAQTPQEVAFDLLCTQSLRLVERGVLPSFASCPASLSSRMAVKAVSLMLGRPEFTDLRALLLKHLDFEALPGLVRPESPSLLVGAADVLEGTFKIFSSVRGEIQVDSLLASAAIPNLFPAVWVNGHAYWDGIFSTNPPVAGFLQKEYVGPGRTSRPEEIWIIQVNRSEIATVPEGPSEIFDRRNHLGGNLSLQHELQLIGVINLLITEQALTDKFRATLELDAVEPITVRFIRMSKDLAQSLDYPSKLSRQPAHIRRLLAHGEAQAAAFLDERLNTDAAVSPEGEVAAMH